MKTVNLWVVWMRKPPTSPSWDRDVWRTRAFARDMARDFRERKWETRITKIVVPVPKGGEK